MKFAQENIARAAKDLALMIDKSGAVPILSNVAIRVTGDKASLTTTNLDQQASVTIPVDAKQDIAFTIPGDKLASIASASKSDLVMDYDDGFVTAKSGRAKWKLPTLNIVDYPALDNDIKGSTFIIDSNRLKSLFETISGAMSQEDAKYYLRGIYLHSIDGKLAMVATDGHKVSVVVCDDIEYSGDGVIIPSANIAQIIKIMAGYNGPVTITVNDKRVAYRYGETTISTKVVDGSFPDYQRVIPKNNERVVTLEACALTSAVKRVSILADDKSRSVLLDIADDVLKISVIASDGGVAEDEVCCEFSGPPIKFKCNSLYLVSQIEAAGNLVKIEFGNANDGREPVRLISSDNVGYEGVLMGMRF